MPRAGENLYGLVRKGSMGTSTEGSGWTWRGKLCVTTDHPGLPEALKSI
ncbi:hypothetical protein ACU4HD_26210 [Cupriavidus basilensis]